MYTESYADNIYSNDYYLAQYILIKVCIEKKNCVLLLTEKEVQMLQERISQIIYKKLYEVNDSNQIVYQIYQK